jgi:hypothetical protein
VNIQKNKMKRNLYLCSAIPVPLIGLVSAIDDYRVNGELQIANDVYGIYV